METRKEWWVDSGAEGVLENMQGKQCSNQLVMSAMGKVSKSLTCISYLPEGIFK